jgi:hypothetical protein
MNTPVDGGSFEIGAFFICIFSTGLDDWQLANNMHNEVIANNIAKYFIGEDIVLPLLYHSQIVLLLKLVVDIKYIEWL